MFQIDAREHNDDTTSRSLYPREPYPNKELTGIKEIVS